MHKQMESGTHGRKWYMTEGNIAFSFATSPNCNIEALEGITLEIAETILQIFKQMYGIDLEIKLPNDIVKNGKKIGGILTQTKLQGKIVKYLVIGIGINTSKISYEGATSIKKEWNIEVDNSEVITKFYNIFKEKLIKRMEN